MTNYTVNFALNKIEQITVDSAVSFNLVHCCHEANFFFIKDAKKIILSDDSIRENLTILASLLTKALSNSLLLHNSITNDIGYLYNEYLTDGLNLAYENINGTKFWVGNRYNLWTHYFATWIYNDKKGAIIFEITPVYPCSWIGPEEEQGFISYEEWKKNYKPYLITTISHDVARQWLEQANILLKKIEHNVKKEFNIKD